MPFASGWTGAQFTTPPSGQSAGSAYSSGASGNATAQTPQVAAGAPNWSGGLMSSGVQQCLALAAVIVFLAAWHAHGFSLIE